MKPIHSFQPPQRPVNPFTHGHGIKPGGASAPGSEAGSFAKLMGDQVKNVNTMQTSADSMVHSLLTGGDVNEAEVLTSVQKADLAFRMLLQVRNKLLEAYREVQQIQI